MRVATSREAFVVLVYVGIGSPILALTKSGDHARRKRPEKEIGDRMVIGGKCNVQGQEVK